MTRDTSFCRIPVVDVNWSAILPKTPSVLHLVTSVCKIWFPLFFLLYCVPLITNPCPVNPEQGLSPRRLLYIQDNTCQARELPSFRASIFTFDAIFIMSFLISAMFCVISNVLSEMHPTGHSFERAAVLWDLRLGARQWSVAPIVGVLLFASRRIE